MLRCFRTRGGHRKFRTRDVKAFLEDETPPQMVPAQDRQNRGNGEASAGEGATDPDLGAQARPDEARALALAGDVDGLVSLIGDAHLRGVPLAWIFDRVLTPAMQSIGEGWALGTVSIAQEHVASATIGEMLTRVRPLVEGRPRPDRGRALCACIGDEQHDLAARMVALVLIEQGFRTVPVMVGAGAGMSSGDLARMLASERPALLALSASAHTKGDLLRGDLAILASAATASRTRLVVDSGFARLPSLPGVVRRHDRLADLVAAAQGDASPGAPAHPPAPLPQATRETGERGERAERSIEQKAAV
jgi:methanogenic corrinoid protein MtbC1